MTHLIRRSETATWGAWLVAGAVGTLLPILPAAVNHRFPLGANLGFNDEYGLSSLVVAALCLALLQSIVLGVLRGRFSGPVLLWAPVSAGATLAVYVAIFVWQVTSVSSIESSLPSGFPMLAVAVLIVLTPSPLPWFQVLIVLIALAVAAVLGLAQGILLARIFERASIVGLWLAANLVGAVAVGILFGIRFQETATSNDATLTAFVSNALIDGGLYATVTGAALVAIARRNGQILVRPET